jgi:branched-chain amino acid transport system substrate-binding protein
MAVKRSTLLLAVLSVVVLVVVGTLAYMYWYAPRPPEEIKIGIIYHSGDPVDAIAVKAGELAVREINEKGGLLGRPVKLLVEDCKGEVPLAVSAYEKLVTKERCIYIVSARGAEVLLAMQERGATLYKEYPHLLSSPVGTDEFCDRVRTDYEKYKFSFRVSAFSNREWTRIAVGFLKDLKEKWGLKKIAVLYEDLVWTKPIRDGDPRFNYPPFREQLKAIGLEVVYEATIAPGEKMFLPIFEAIAKSGAELISGFHLCYIDTVTFCKQWAASPARNTPIIIGWGAPGLLAYWNWTGGACLGGIVPWPQVPFDYPPPCPSFSKTWEKLYKEYGVTWSYRSYLYNDIKFFAAAVEKAGTLDVEKIIKTMEEIEVPGIVGIMKLDKRTHEPVVGFPYIDLWMGQWQGSGKLVIIWPPQLAQAELKTLQELRGR